jgi:hypothetical protein
LKVPAAMGVITIHGCQKDAKNIEQGLAPGHRYVNCLPDEKAKNDSNTTKRMNEGTFGSRPSELECETRKVSIDPRVPVTPGFKIKNQMLIVCMSKNNLSYIRLEL